MIALLTSRVAIGVYASTALLAAVWFLQHRAYERGYRAHQSEMAAAAIRAERERVKDDARLNGLTDFDLCAEYLRARGMPVDACNVLRGLQAE